MKKIIAVIFALSITGALCYQPYLAYATINDAISYWAFDESSGDAADSSGNSKTLTNNNTTPYVAAKINNGADLERGSTQYFSRSNGTYYDGTSGTINCWIKPETITSVLTIVSHGTGAGTGGLDFRVNSFAGNVLDAYFGGDAFEVTGTTGLSNGSTYMVTFTWDTLRKEIFLNGTSDGANETDQTMGAGTTNLFIGMRQGVGEGFDGLVDECGWWNRVLSGAEITALYNAGAGTNPYAPAAAVNNTYTRVQWW